jgi:NAD(P)-dependent dehydrogenase (short-subunit alcohol dehydrogenase family)
MDLTGAAALVTGAGSGLGAATAEALARAGARVVAMDLNAEGLAALAARCGATPAIGDVASEADVTAALDAVQGPLRLAVNCAGIAPAARVVGRQGAHDLALFERTLRVNLLGTFNVLRLSAARMQALDATPPDNERGVIVNTASIAAEDGQVGQCAYAASKAGVIGLTLPAARELARSGIRVVTIAPGLFETPMLAGLPEPAQAAIRALPPFPARLGKPEEFAAMVLAICANPLLNGTTLRLDSALRLPP